MEKLIKELQSIIQFKDTTDCGDIVLVAAKEPQMLFYAYVSAIERDGSKKDEWWHIDMNILSFPPQKVTWTLRTEQMTGAEVFTMGGEERFFKAIDFTTEKIHPDNHAGEARKMGRIKRIK